MDKEIIYKLFLLGQLHEHRADYMNDNSAELLNPINKIIVKIISKDEIQVRYNYYDENLIVMLTSETIYDFLEDLLTRDNAHKINTKTGELILIEKWKDELKDYIMKIQLDKEYDRYLKHVKLESMRFEIEYYDGIIVLRDKNKELITNILMLKNAVQHAI
ncbi:hypothetical protein [Aquimarina intermedia]|uniref:Uncharacterized protein n=1 Tax=Aquimarina intermedia TaxID=350814 RepID=A0A5S5C7D0_9FLAO|nr:hypothetical protein [Aquimarina intermedia]TYP75315.1 hypothetical protein BD809_103379 [Aquimarina intermedia]